MIRSLRAVAFVTLLAAVVAAQPTARVHGVVSDESGGVLPGVTVTVAAADGRPIAVTTTDDVGAFATPVPAGRFKLSFALDGFSSSVLDVDVGANTDTAVPVHLALAPRSEVVVVQGRAPAAPASRPGPAQAPPPPPVVPLVPHDRDSICGPAKPSATPESLGTIQALRYNSGPELFAADDQVTIDGGTFTGLTVGQNVVARRTYRIDSDAENKIGEHTAGVLQIVAATDRMSIAVVVYACDEIMRGDRLAPFAPEPLRAPEPAGVPAYDHAARILFADSGQMLGAPRRLLVIDHGRVEAMHAGQRVTLFRRSRRDHQTPVVLGDAVVVAVRDDSATIRVEHAFDAIEPGDWAAPERIAVSQR